MKRNFDCNAYFRLVCVGACLTLLTTAAVVATEAPDDQKAFERLKALEGTWQGEAGPEAGPMEPTTFVYEVTSAGHTVVERMFADTEHEMINVYWLEEGELVATHFCAAGNQPRFRMSDDSSGDRLVLAFDGGSNLDAIPGHIHDGRIEWKGEDWMSAVWNSRNGDSPAGTMLFELRRVR